MDSGFAAGAAIAFAAAASMAFCGTAAAQSGDKIETVVVTASTPLPGSGIDAGKLAGEVDTVSMNSLLRDRQPTALPDAAATQLSSIGLNDEQGSDAQPDFVYRGFEASPIAGVAEGIAVYRDGMRLNEAFGDNVDWDLIPEFAVGTFTLQSNNPVFGLNTMGGAVTLEMKSGLDFEGAQAELSGGSFGNVSGNAQYGTRFGEFALYIGIGGSHDDGFRYRSPSTLRQAYGDLAHRDGGLTLHLSFSGASNRIDAAGPTPVQMLAKDRRAIFTSPQGMRNTAETVQFRGTYRMNSAVNLSFDTYVRRFRQHLVDGNTTGVMRCVNDSAQLCLEGNNLYPDDALYDSSGLPVPASVLPAGATPGETDFTQTDSRTMGAAMQLAWKQAIAGHGNDFVVGASVDRGDTDYAAYGELGTLGDDLRVIGSGIVIDQSLSPAAAPPIVAPVNVAARNIYGGIYAIDVFDVTPALSLTLSGRLNTVSIGMSDRHGAALDGRHGYTHLNPGAGLSYRLANNLTAYAGYSGSNRAPAPGELSCANPASPCILDAFLVSDPPLKQVISRSVEFGLRGHFGIGALPGMFDWKAGAYRTDADDDILLLASAVNGFGYFRNAGATRHEGMDLHLGYSGGGWKIAASYSYLNATFLDALTLSSNSPAADANDLIYVKAGDRIPMNPANRIVLSADYALTPRLSAGADMRMQSGQYLVGDASNREPELPGFATFGFRFAYDVTAQFTVFGGIENLFNRRYYTYGAFTELDGLPPDLKLTDPRTYSPAQGRTLYAGLRAAL